MNGFLYFIPKATAVNDKGLRSLGLAGIDPAHYEQGLLNDGPGGGSGVFIRASGSKGALGYNAEAQTWYPGPDKKWWLGFETACPPGPDDLKRDRMVAGLDVELADGNKWHCPTARHHLLDTPPAAFPQVYGLDGDGNEAMLVAKEYRQLWDVACSVMDGFMAAAREDPEHALTMQGELEAAEIALAANYRLGPFEIRALGILRTDLQTDIVRALIDSAGLEALLAEQKEESGAEGNVPDTGTG